MRPPSTTVKTLRSFLACLMAIVLSVGLTPAMPREASATEGDTAAEASVRSTDWQRIDECEWRIDDAGCLTIQPAKRATGNLEVNFDSYSEPEYAWPWHNERDNIASIIIEKGVNGKGSLESIFEDCRNLTSIDLSGLDTSSVTDMGYMFAGCESLTDLDVSGFDTSSVTDMRFMFYSCSSLTLLGLSGLDMSNVTNVRGMFYLCSGLTSIDLSGLDTSNVTDMSSMFGHCYGLTLLDLSGLDTSNVTDMSFMFGRCSSLTSIDLSGLDTSNVTSMGSMFDSCSSLTLLNLSGLDMSNVKIMQSMFEGCSGLTSLDLSGLDMSNVTNMKSMFLGCDNLVSLDFSDVELNDNTWIYAPSAFGRCYNLAKVSFSAKSSAIADELPSPDPIYIFGADGDWYNTAGEAFYRVPSGVADTYYASKSLIPDAPPEEPEGVISHITEVAACELSSLYGLVDEWHPDEFNGESVQSSIDIISYADEPIWNGQTVKRSDLVEQELSSWTVEAANTDPFSVVVSKDGKCIVAFGDNREFSLKSDVEHLKNAANLYADAVEKFGAENAHVVGAGYGGMLASYVCTTFDAVGTIYNSAGYGIDIALVNNLTDLAAFDGVQDIPVRHYYTQAYYDMHVDEDASDEFTFYPTAKVAYNAFENDPSELSSMYSYVDGTFVFDEIVSQSDGRATVHQAGAPTSAYKLAFGVLADAGGTILDFFRTRNLLSVGTDGEDDFSTVWYEFDNNKAQTVYTGASNGGRDEVKTGNWGDAIVANAGKSKLNGGFGDDVYIIGPDATDVEINDYTHSGFGTLVDIKEYIDIARSLAGSIASDDVFSAFEGGYGLGEKLADGISGDVVIIPASFDDVEVVQDGDYVKLTYGGKTVRVNSNRLLWQGVSVMDKNGDLKTLAELSRSRASLTVPLSVEIGKAAQVAVKGPASATVKDAAAGTELFKLESSQPTERFESYGYFTVEDDGGFVFEYDAEQVMVEFEDGSVDALNAACVEEASNCELTCYGIGSTTSPELGGKVLSVTQGQAGLDFTLSGEGVTSKLPVSTSNTNGDNLDGKVLLANEHIAFVDKQEWSGSDVCPKPEVTVNGVNLTEGKDFAYSYSENDSVGLATVTVTGQGDYSGSVTKTFEIVDEEPPFLEEDPTPETPGTEEPDDPSGGNPGVTLPSTPTTPAAMHEVSLDYDDSRGTVEISSEDVKAGEDVTVMGIPRFGYAATGYFVYAKDGTLIDVNHEANGEPWNFEMPNSDVTVMVSFTIPAWENPFTDVPQTEWYWDSVRRTNLAGLMKGYDGVGLFGPDDGLAREQAATVMWNLMGRDDTTRPAAAHSDVVQGEWYAPQVNWAVDAKVMDGYDAVTFGVGDELTREQFAAVIAKAVGADVDSADQTALGAFQDADGVSGWAQATMAWAVETGVLNGVENPDGSRELQATRTLTRAEMATMMMNAIDKDILKLDAR